MLADDATRLEDGATRLAGSKTASSAGTRGDAVAGTSGWLSSSGSIDHGRFAPGTISTAGIGSSAARSWRHGRGVSRRRPALGQPVALKFLPAALATTGAAGAAPQRGPHRAAGLASERLPRVRHRRSRWPALPVDGVRRRRGSRDVAATHRTIPRGQGDRHRAAALRGPGGRARAGVLHRDLKPANVMIDGGARSGVMDFGLAAVGAARTPRRHAGVHGAGAARRPRGHRTANLRARSGAVRALHRPARVHGEDADELVSSSEAGAADAADLDRDGHRPGGRAAILRCLEPRSRSAPAFRARRVGVPARRRSARGGAGCRRDAVAGNGRCRRWGTAGAHTRGRAWCSWRSSWRCFSRSPHCRSRVRRRTSALAKSRTGAHRQSGGATTDVRLRVGRGGHAVRLLLDTDYLNWAHRNGAGASVGSNSRPAVPPPWGYRSGGARTSSCRPDQDSNVSVGARR